MIAKVVNCPCGEKMTGDTDDELVKLVQEHGKEVHQQDVSGDDALAMAQPADEPHSPRKTPMARSDEMGAGQIIIAPLS